MLLAYTLAYGPLVLALALSIGAVGVPLPGTMLLLASGAFVRQGMLNGPLAVTCGLVGVVLGDNAGFVLGRLGGPRLQRDMVTAAWCRAQAIFQRWGGLAVLCSRFLLTPLGAPINLIAGSSRYAAWRFLAFDTAGECIWVLGYGSLGYVFAGTWETLNTLVGNLTGLVIGILGLLLGSYIAYRYVHGRAAHTLVSEKPGTRCAEGWSKQG